MSGRPNKNATAEITAVARFMLHDQKSEKLASLLALLSAFAALLAALLMPVALRLIRLSAASGLASDLVHVVAILNHVLAAELLGVTFFLRHDETPFAASLRSIGGGDRLRPMPTGRKGR
jgi:hypothetical protein